MSTYHTPLLPVSTKYHRALRKARRFRKNHGDAFPGLLQILGKTFEQFVNGWVCDDDDGKTIHDTNRMLCEALGPHLSAPLLRLDRFYEHLIPPILVFED